MKPTKKTLKKESENNKNKITVKALNIREEMIHIFEDLKHDPHNLELLSRFHEKCMEFNKLLKEINQRYENTHNTQGIFQTKN